MASSPKQPRLDEPGSKAIDEIDACQSQLDELNEKASEEILIVEKKYNQLRQPLYQRRNEVIAKVPGFWLTCFLSHQQIRSIICEKDEQLLQHLTKLEVEERDDIRSGYKIRLHFSDNPFFTNATLTKEISLTGEETVPSADATSIDWKSGMNYLQELEATQDDNDGPVSFFHWFLDTDDVLPDQIGEAIKEEIFTNPLHYYMGSGDDGLSDEEDGLEEIGEDEYADEEDEADEDADEAEEDADEAEEEVDEEGDENL